MSLFRRVAQQARSLLDRPEAHSRRRALPIADIEPSAAAGLSGALRLAVDTASADRPHPAPTMCRDDTLA